MVFDILATNETKLDNYGANSQISLPGHTGVRKDRNKYWGGVRIYKVNSINFTRKLNLRLRFRNDINRDINPIPAYFY